MRLRQFSTISGGIAGLMMMTSAAVAGSTLDGWEMLQASGRESVRVTWTEPAEVELTEFPAARQFVLRIPKAEAASLAPLATTPDARLEATRVQNVTLADGRDALQMTFNLRDWAEPRLETAPGSFTVSWTPMPEAKAAEKAPVLTLSNEDLTTPRKNFGSPSAPASGAGQGTNNDVFSAFYVPPDLSQEEKTAGRMGVDQGMLNTMELFNRTVNMDYKDASLENVLRSIANKLNLNIIMMPGDVQGRVTVSLSNVRLGDAFDSMLKANGLGYKIEEGGIIRIVPRELVQVTDREFATQALAVNWVDSAEVVAVLQPFLSEDGQLQFHRQTNTIIVRDVPEIVTELQSLVERIDVPEKQVRMEVRLVDMTEEAFRALGFQNSIVSQETQSFNLVGGDGTVNVDDVAVIPDVVASGGGAVSATNGLDASIQTTFSALGNEYSLDSQLTALETRREAVILANPTILSLNNTPAMIEILRQIPYLDATNTTQGSVSTIQFQEVGTRVEITPRITNNGYVIMDIEPEQKIQVDEALGVPVIDERFAITSVIAKDEQTVALGGLRQFESLNEREGIPWILNVPVIGQFFRTSSDRQVKTELALFVTPHIVKDPEPSVYEMALYEKIDYNWELPDYWFDEVRARDHPNETIDPRAMPR